MLMPATSGRELTDRVLGLGTRGLAVNSASMDEEVIAHIRDRVVRVRKIASMAHDPEMIEMLLKLADEGEADIKKLEKDMRRPG